MAIARDVPILTKYLDDINKKTEQLASHIKLLQEYVSDSKSESNLKLLALKNHLLLSYVTDVSYVVLLKCGGFQPPTVVVDRLVEIRTMIEKVRPIEQKFSYQLDKLLRTSSTNILPVGEHSLQYRPIPENLVSKVIDEDLHAAHGADDLSLSEDAPVRIYVPPRVVAMPYEEQTRSIPGSQFEKNRLINELKDELSEFPAEFQTSGRLKKQELNDDKMRERYEEEYMVRLTNRKKSRYLGQRVQEDLLDFSSLKGLIRGKTTVKTKLKRAKGLKKAKRTK